MAQQGEPVIVFELKLSSAQLGEIWGAPSDDEATALLARIAQVEDPDEEPRKTIWLDFMYQQLIFAKEQRLVAPKALAFFDTMLKTHKHVVESMCTAKEGFQFFAGAILAATKALPVRDRFSYVEMQALSEHVRTAYLQSIKLHQLVFAQRQTTRDSSADLFVQTPYPPMPLAAASDEPPPAPPAAAPEAAPEAPAAAPAEAPAAAPAEEPAAAPAEAPAAAPAAEPPLGDAALAEAIGKSMEAQVAALKERMAAEYAAQESALLERISKLESK